MELGHAALIKPISFIWSGDGSYTPIPKVDTGCALKVPEAATRPKVHRSKSSQHLGGKLVNENSMYAIWGANMEEKWDINLIFF